MMLRTLTWIALFTLPLTAQARPAETVDHIFYRAFFLERGQRDYAGAAKLYQEFLSQAPDSRFAARAARSAYGLLARLDRQEAAEAFRKSHTKILGETEAIAEKADAVAKPSDGDAAKPPAASEPRRGRRGGRGGGGRRGGGRGGAFSIFSSDQKLTEMDDQAIAEFRTSLERISGFTDRMRQGGREQQAEQLEASIVKINAHLDAGKIAEAQKVLEAMRAGFRRR